MLRLKSKAQRNKGLQDKLNIRRTVKIGITRKSNQQTNEKIDLAGLVAIHYYGSESRNIPPTDMFKQPLERHKDGINQRIKAKTMNKTPEHLAAIVGMEHVNNVKLAFTSQGDGTWKPLLPQTIKRKPKGKTKRLINTGLMLRSIDFDVVQ